MDKQKEKKQGHKGKGQKYKSLLVWDILQKRTDENHAIQLKEIVEHLKMNDITAKHHSVTRDIDDILILLNKEPDIACIGTQVRLSQGAFFATGGIILDT